MLKELAVVILLSAVLTVIAGLIFIPVLRKIKAGQTILKYVEEHKSKNGTPTMGGLFFLISAAGVYYAVYGFTNRIANAVTAIGAAYALVGFLDDLLKVRQKQNLGLKAYQKIIFQVAIALMAGKFAYNNGLNFFYVPFTRTAVNLGGWTVPVAAFIFLALTNSVNLTDGLDGLASSTSCAYLASLVALTYAQINLFGENYIELTEFHSLTGLSSALIGALLGFLVFNTNKASVFMGDTGAMGLGGFLGALSIFSLNGFFIPVIGIMFVLSSISVIMQVLYYKRRKKRIFLMAPLHHHFQHKGISESKISFVYAFVTLAFGAVSLFSYL